MNSSIKIFYWLPRIICILAIIFISIFAADAFEPGKSIGQQLTAFLIHLIPSFVLLLLLLLAWKRELMGGIIFTVIGIALTPVIFLHNYNANHFQVAQCIGIVLMITFPFIISGILFLTNYFIKRKQSV